MSEQSNPVKSISPKPGSLRTRENSNSNLVYGRIQPQAVELEEAVLGAIMLDKDALPIVLDILSVDSFYHPSHQAIYQCMLELLKKVYLSIY